MAQTFADLGQIEPDCFNKKRDFGQLRPSSPEIRSHPAKAGPKEVEFGRNQAKSADIET